MGSDGFVFKEYEALVFTAEGNEGDCVVGFDEGGELVFQLFTDVWECAVHGARDIGEEVVVGGRGGGGGSFCESFGGQEVDSGCELGLRMHVVVLN